LDQENLVEGCGLKFASATIRDNDTAPAHWRARLVFERTHPAGLLAIADEVID
jgi:hypothetical protein